MKKIIFSLVFVLVGLFAFVAIAKADSFFVNFESYNLGNINGQDGWIKSGPYDVEVVNSPASFPTFGLKSLRISNGVASGSFGDQTFSKSLTDEAGETSAENGGLSGGVRQKHFEAQFDLASVMSTIQPGLAISVSPDRGDGARMSYLRFEDKADGVHVFFNGYVDAAPIGTFLHDPNGCGNEDYFTNPDIATLNRTNPHTIKFVMDFVDGPANDVVKIYIDGQLKTTGTSWEDYFRYCEGNPTRTVDSLLFRAGGASVPGNLNNGFLIDNLNLLSSTLINKDQCKNNGWLNYVDADGNSFKNQGDCIKFVQSGPKDIATGDVYLQSGGNDTHIVFDAHAGNPTKGSLTWDRTGTYANHIVGDVIETNFSGPDADFVINITESSNFPEWVGWHLKFIVHDGGSPGTNGDTLAWQWVTGPYAGSSATEPIVSGNLVVHD